MKLNFVALSGLLFISVHGPITAEEFESVSMIAVIASPYEYKAKTLQLTGYLKLQFEENALYFDEQMEFWGRGENAVFLHLSNEQLERWNEYSDSYVYVRGEFYPVEGTYLGGFRLELKNISRISPLLSKDEIDKMQERARCEFNEDKQGPD